MTTKRKIAIGLCLFLTLAPLLGSFFTDNAVGLYIGNLTPYFHLTIGQVDGLPFGDAIGAMFALLIFLVGLIGFIIFVITKFKKTGGLIFFLYLTMIYCGLRALGGLAFNIFSFTDYDAFSKIFIVATILTDIAWGLFCYWATKILTTKNTTDTNISSRSQLSTQEKNLNTLFYSSVCK